MHLSRRGLLMTAAALPLIPRPTWAQAKDSLIMGLSSYPPNIDPFLHGGTAAGTVKLCIFRGLTSFAESGSVQPELAESFEPETETTWVFRLRDALFHDGSPVTAEDVKWTIETVAAETSTAYMRSEFQTVTSVETPDAKTVRITTATPTVTLPLWFANFNMPIIKKDSLENPIGAGPFTLKNQDRGVAIDLEAFDRFYKPGLPKLRSIRMVAYADENLRVAALQTGDVDLIEYVPWQSMAAIEGDSALRLTTTNGPFMGLGFNGARGPFADPKVRQAAAFAINRQDIVDAVFFGRGAPLESIPYEVDGPFFNEDLSTHWRYDPDKAMALLAEAGMDGGFECTLLSTSQYGMHKTTAEIVQQYLAQVNIAVTLNMPDWATRQALGGRGQYDILIDGTTAESPDPDGLAPILDSTLSPSSSRSYGIPATRLHELFVQGRAEFDQDKRKAIYRDLELELHQIVTKCGLAWRSQGYAMRANLDGFANLPGSLTFYSGRTLETTSFA
ncbi:ABC transporter substrate-binding protein [Marinivivus vitaminiproducens]|uniref:ABC transporter substrate-binding protein n=1 Tax=Marinivivus vitaminiproducens TaxID=3035935 RepID=UPI0027A13FF2|nr:ABC transporter substrate-binding protein [Geminicoccaceae bacterium SCSIO 64248]